MGASAWGGDYQGHRIVVELRNLSKGVDAIKAAVAYLMAGNEFRLVIDDRVADTASLVMGRETLRGELTLAGAQVPVVVDVKAGWIGFKLAGRVGQQKVDMALLY